MSISRSKLQQAQAAAAKRLDILENTLEETWQIANEAGCYASDCCTNEGSRPEAKPSQQEESLVLQDFKIW